MWVLGWAWLLSGLRNNRNAAMLYEYNVLDTKEHGFNLPPTRHVIQYEYLYSLFLNTVFAR